MAAYDGLTDKQRLWVDHYLGRGNCNATEAARLAGYSDPQQSGWENKSNLVIQAAIGERMRQSALDADEILTRLTEQARGAHTAFIRVKRGQAYIDLAALEAAGLMRLVKSVKPGKYGQVVEFYDAQAALLALGKRYDLFPDSMKHSGMVTLDAVLNALPEPLRGDVGRALAGLVRNGAGAGSNGRT